MTVARLWFAFGVIALLLSGALSMIVTGAKMPFFRAYVTDLEIIRRCLVVHVNLATLVWFASIPVAMTRLVTFGRDDRRYLGFFASVAGIVLMSAAAFFPGAEAVLANYIPVLNHPVHDWGLGLFFAGVVATYLHPSILFQKTAEEGPLADSRLGLWVGGLFFLSAAAALALAFPALSRTSFLEVKTYFEIGMWGGGHLLQHSSAVFLVVAWAWLLRSSGLEGGVLRRENLRWIYLLMAAPLTIVPFIFALAPWSNEYRESFTQLMRWGIAPPMLVFLFGVFALLGRGGKPVSSPEQRLSRVAWGFSSLLAVLGFTFGAFINGPDLRVPGHYHATIGSVTIAFLLVSYRLLFREARDDRAMKGAVWCYGIGQSLFASGMFLAGASGLGRKTYGAEHVVGNLGQKIGMGVFGFGGLLALAGGVLFGVAVVRAYRRGAASPSSSAH